MLPAELLASRFEQVGLKEHVGQVDAVVAAGVAQVDLEGPVGTLAAVGYLEGHVEVGGAEDEAVVVEELLLLHQIVDGESHVPRALTQQAWQHRHAHVKQVLFLKRGASQNLISLDKYNKC